MSRNVIEPILDVVIEPILGRACEIYIFILRSNKALPSNPIHV